MEKLKEVLDITTRFADFAKEIRENFIESMKQINFTQEEAEEILANTEHVLEGINRKRNFSKIFKEPEFHPTVSNTHI